MRELVRGVEEKLRLMVLTGMRAARRPTLRSWTMRVNFARWESSVKER
jgi:hypothetical protein